MSPHPDDQQLLEMMYGIVEKPLHLQVCKDCQNRLRALDRLRVQSTASEPVSTEFLAAQRRRIYARIGERRASIEVLARKWVPAAAAAFVLTIGLLFYRPSPVASPHRIAPAPHSDAADAQLFSDVYAMEQSSDPPAAAPIHALFEDNQ